MSLIRMIIAMRRRRSMTMRRLRRTIMRMVLICMIRDRIKERDIPLGRATNNESLQFS